MNAKHVALLSLLIAAAALVSIASRAPAQAQGNAQSSQLKIATANTSKIFLGMKERSEVQARFKQELADLDNQNKSRQQKVVDLRNQLELINPEAPQYEEQSRAYMQAASEHKAWLELNQGIASRNEKLQLKMLFDKITDTIGEIAKQRGVDLVLSEQPAFNIDRMSSADLTQAMTQREVLYKNAALDLTADVIAKLDERYNAAKK
ncbi:MAG TPA: OmpH family outer membrane protein [Tepidisphaeraceae bacterium]|nr:OmpH family outer membrane protein [Tepidisphaeraceae bacterium]